MKTFNFAPDYSHITRQTKEALANLRITKGLYYPDEWAKYLMAEHTDRVRELKDICKKYYIEVEGR